MATMAVVKLERSAEDDDSWLYGGPGNRSIDQIVAKKLDKFHFNAHNLKFDPQ